MIAKLPIYYQVFVEDGVLMKEVVASYEIAINSLIERGKKEGVVPVAIFDEEQNIMHYTTAVGDSGFGLGAISEICGLRTHHKFADTGRIPFSISIDHR